METLLASAARPLAGTQQRLFCGGREGVPPTKEKRLEKKLNQAKAQEAAMYARASGGVVVHHEPRPCPSLSYEKRKKTNNKTREKATGCRRLKNTSGSDLPEVFFNLFFFYVFF